MVLARPGNALYRGDRFMDRLHVRLFTAEYREIGRDWQTRNVLSSYWRFYANSTDGAALRLPDPDGGETEVLYPLAAGALYFVPAGVRFSCDCRAERVGHFYTHFDVLGLPTPALREVFTAPVRLPPSPELAAQVRSVSEGLVERPSPTMRDDLELHCRLKSLLYAGLASCFAALHPEQRERLLVRAAALEPVRPALDFMEAHLAEKISMKTLAEACYLSEDHFQRKFRRYVGVTPGEWLTERRVQEAAQRLLFTDQTMEEIARDCGFANRFYLTRVFTRTVGIPPAAYRKSRPV